jgi:hypothetical protein
MLTIVVEYLFEKLELLNLVKHVGSLLSHDLDHLASFGTLVVNLVFLGHKYFIGSFERSLEA